MVPKLTDQRLVKADWNIRKLLVSEPTGLHFLMENFVYLFNQTLSPSVVAVTKY